MRPPGSFGDLALALQQAAADGPGTVRELAQRAQVAYGAARYTASRLVDRGELVVAAQGRPAVLSARGAAPGRRDDDSPPPLLVLEAVWASFE